ncbi:sporulation histidine kinase inhibitor Sda [Virgibacillus sp. L01]
MKELSDEALIQAYIKAKKLRLDPEFISVIADEMKQRKLDLSDPDAD